MLKKAFGKYSVLAISIALFIILDLGVLVLNFHISGEIKKQTELINLAGRQRTLTQQMSKATLYLKAQKLQQWVYLSGLDELREHYTVFGDTLDAFNNGGMTSSAETGEPVQVERVSSGAAREILSSANALWTGFENVLEPMMKDDLITDEEIVPASDFIAKNNLAMFGLMNDLTQQFTKESAEQTGFLRKVQLGGIALATINFFIILFHFIGQLRRRDKKLEIKQKESDQILKAIDEGVFLVDRSLRMGGQHSRHLEEIFGTKKVSGIKLAKFLNAYLPSKTVKTAMDFVKLFFAGHVSSDLISDLNPLRRVKATMPLKSGNVEQKYLDFSFAAFEQESGEPAILVTVKDVTDSIHLEQQTEKNEKQANEQLELFTQVLPIPSIELTAFLAEAESGFEDLNQLLKTSKGNKDNYQTTLNRLYREAHKLKGSSASLNFTWMTQQIHEFEDEISAIQDRAKTDILSGEDLLPLVISLKKMYLSLEKVQDLKARLASFGAEQPLRDTTVVASPLANEPAENSRWFGLRKLADSVAKDEQVSVDLILRGFNAPIDQKLTDMLYPIAVQFLRNSIAHGVENEKTRERLKKPNSGQISISISHDGNQGYRFLFEDDGRGFDYPGIRETLVERGQFSKSDVLQLSKTDLVRFAFKDNVSTRENVDMNAGRGVGLALVWDCVKQLDGHLKVRSVENEFTQFILDFNYVSEEPSAPLVVHS